jgi:hypothetical protein
MRVHLALLLALFAATLPHASGSTRGKLLVEDDAEVSFPNGAGTRRRTMKGARVANSKGVENLPSEEEEASGGVPTKIPSEQNAGEQVAPKEPKETERKKRSKQSANKGGKLVKPKKIGDKLEKGGGKKSMRNPRGKGKGKGKGKGGQSPTDCTSSVADAIVAAVPEAITKNPSRCCYFTGPTAVYVTHAELSDETASGFEPFWDRFYQIVSATSEQADVCFVMTGYDQTSERGISEILIDVNEIVSNLHDVPAMMTTDPTTNVLLIQKIRSIANTPALPSIGVLNTGFPNLLIESIVSGMGRLPFIGLLDDTDFGEIAGKITLDLLGETTAVPLCFNGRPELDFIGNRCAAYYAAVTFETIDPPTGVSCSANSLVEDILTVIVESGANAVWSHVDCCTTVAQAAEMAGMISGTEIVVGCQDADTTGGMINFVTAQPIELQAYSASSWVNFPVIQAQQGKDGRGEQYFPSLNSLVHTAVFNNIII